MPPALRAFLLRCAVLPELTAVRCAQVSGAADAARLLDDVASRGHFVTVLDADEPTLRQHDLVRDFLLDRLARDHPEELPDLLFRAGRGEPDLARAVGNFAQAGASDLVAYGNALSACDGGRGGEVAALLSVMVESLERVPDLAVWTRCARLAAAYDVCRWLGSPHRATRDLDAARA